MPRALLVYGLLTGPAMLAAQASPFDGAPQVLGEKGRLHDDQVASVAFAGDGRLMLSAGRDWHVKVWDRASGDLVHDHECAAVVTAAVFCVGAPSVGADADAGPSVAALERQVGVRIFAARTGAAIARVPGEFLGLAVSPDGRCLATVGRAGAVRLLGSDGAAVGEVALGAGHDAPLFSPDGALLLVHESFGRSVAVVDLALRRQVGALELPGFVARLAFAPDGRSIVAALGGGLARFSVPGGEHLGAWELPSSPSALVVKDADTVIFGDGDGAIVQLDLATDTIGSVQVGHYGTVADLALAADGALLLSGGRDRYVRAWRADDLSAQLAGPGHGDAVTAVAWSADGGIVSGGRDGVVVRWQGGRRVATARPHAHQVTAIAVAADGSQWTAGHDGALLHSDVRGRPLAAIQLADDDAPALCLATAGDGTLIAGHGDGSLRWYRDGGELRRMVGHHEPVLQVVCSGDGGQVVSGDLGGRVIVWDVAAAALGHVLAAHDGAVSGLCLVAGGALVSAGHDRAIKRWSLATGELLQATLVGEGDVAAVGGLVCCAPQGLLVAISADKLRCFAVGDLAFRGELGEVPAVPVACAAAPDGRRVAAGMMDGTVVVWSLAADVAGGEAGDGR